MYQDSEETISMSPLYLPDLDWSQEADTVLSRKQQRWEEYTYVFSIALRYIFSCLLSVE